MTTSTATTTLRTLRAVVPQRSVDFDEALQVAELQACKLHDLIGSPEGVQEIHLAQMPRIRVVYEAGIGVSGMSHWTGTTWLITINAGDSPARQRFTMLHEFKHILDHGDTTRLYTGSRHKSAIEQAEAAADYFAGCVLMPKRLLKRMWGLGMQRPSDLASHFGVSQQAAQVRVAQTGLDALSDQPAPSRCARPISTPRFERQRFQPVRRTYARRTFA